nr:hypothetical protein [Tanacetum cinerariifolium]
GISEVGYGIRDTWMDQAEAVPEIAPMTLGELVDFLMEDRIAYQETILIVEEEAYDVRVAWANSIGLSQAVYSELQTQRAGMHVDLPKIESIKDWASPKTSTEIR